MSFVPSHTTVSAPGAAPSAWMLVLHGMFGTGGNWRSFARRLAAERPEWGFALVDLRQHGRSQDAPPPHNVAAAAADLDAVASELAASAPVRAILGHSFGGKVALRFRERRTADLAQAWIVDSSPSPSTEADRERSGVGDVLEMLEAMPPSFPDRDAFVAEVQARGFSRMLAQWLAMNLVPSDGAYALRFDLRALRDLLSDYVAQDLWGTVTDGGVPGELRFVIGERSGVVTADDRHRLAELEAAGRGRVRAHVLDAGHWVHVEALDALVRLVAAELAPAGAPG